MTLQQFAIAVGADTKWVKNAIAALDLTAAYTDEAARRMGLARVIHTTSGIPLKRAYELVSTVLADGSDEDQVVAQSSDGSVRVTVDLRRYISTFHTRLAVARRHRELQRGRPPKPSADPVRLAREYGIDISLLQSHLQRTPEERLRIASANADFIRRFRGSAAR